MVVVELVTVTVACGVKVVVVVANDTVVGSVSVT